MSGIAQKYSIPLPKVWPRRVRSAVIQVISLAHFSLIATRGWAANSWNARVRLKTENDRLRQELSLLREEMRLKDARMLRIPGPVFSAMLNARGAGGGYSGAAGGQQRAGKQIGSLAQAYAQLGLDSKVSDAEVKKAYRKLVSQYHPDKLISRGLPEEMMELAKTRVREINTAYDQIKQARGFK